MEQRQVQDPAPNGKLAAEKTALAKAKAEAKEAAQRARAEEKARQKSDEALAKTQETLSAVRKELVQARRALSASQSALAEMRDKMKSIEPAMPGTDEASAGAPDGDGGERRVSFVVRLVVDRRGNVRRSEVEHAQTGKKEQFPSLEATRLISFMAANAGLADERTAEMVPEEEEAIEMPAPAAVLPSARLVIRDAMVYRPDMPQVRTLALGAYAAFVWRARIEVEGAVAEGLLAEKPAFELRLYASNVRGGQAKLLAMDTGKLAETGTTMEIALPGVDPGLYRLIALAICAPPLALSGYQEGPVLDVVGSPEAAMAASPVARM